MKALLLPLDDRPVTYSFPQLVSRLAGVKALMPPRQLMGSLAAPANPDALIDWADATIKEEQPDAILLGADSLLYGGLINARRSSDSLKQVLDRAQRIARWRQLGRESARVLAQASIMRISDNYDNTEEKPYWSQYGREIFAWSGYLHRLARGETLAPGLLAASEFKIPPPIREDYLSTRRRNLQVNKNLLGLVESGNLDCLVFSLDDSGEVGLNVHERERLVAESQERNVAERVLCYPGADEVLCTLLARWLTTGEARSPRVKVEYSPAGAQNCASRYEGQRVGATVEAQMHAQGLTLSTGKAKPDFLVIVHGREGTQGDHIWLPEQPDLRNVDTARSVKSTLTLLESAAVPVVLVDVAYANGADGDLVEAIIDRPDISGKLWGYAGWNTTGNSAGSALAMGVARFHAGSAGNKNLEEDLKRCLFIRFCDDWAYQARVRRKLSGPVPADELVALMEPYLKRTAAALSYQPGMVKLRQPWHRTFEIEIEVER